MKKFLFDTIDFDAPVVVDTAPTFSETDLEQARADALSLGDARGYARGRTEAERAAQEAVDEKLRILLEGISIALGRLSAGEDRREMEKCIDAARLALHVVHKLMPQLATSHGLPEVERVIAAAMDARREEPRLAVTVATDMLEPLKARIDNLAADRGFAGKIIILTDDAMPLGDCRVEWADGGSERILSRLMMQIEGEFSRALMGMQSSNDLVPGAHSLPAEPQQEETAHTHHPQENA